MSRRREDNRISSERYDQNYCNWEGNNRDRRDSQFQSHYNRSSSDNWNSSNTETYSSSSYKRSTDNASNNTNDLVMYIDANNVGRLIGRGGSKIKVLQDKSSAKINVSNKEYLCIVENVIQLRYFCLYLDRQTIK